MIDLKMLGIVLAIVCICAIAAYGLIVWLLDLITSHPGECECEECEAYRDYAKESDALR